MDNPSPPPPLSLPHSLEPSAMLAIHTYDSGSKAGLRVKIEFGFPLTRLTQQTHNKEPQQPIKETRRKKKRSSLGPVAYRLDLPEELNGVNDTFHVSNRKKYLAYPTLQLPLDEIRVNDKLNFVEEHVEILEREFKKLKRSRIAIVKKMLVFVKKRLKNNLKQFVEKLEDIKGKKFRRIAASATEQEDRNSDTAHIVDKEQSNTAS
ncbi:hypothetical protein Tco_0659904 [Tanacetum coccineum]